MLALSNENSTYQIYFTTNNKYIYIVIILSHVAEGCKTYMYATGINFTMHIFSFGKTDPPDPRNIKLTCNGLNRLHLLI